MNHRVALLVPAVLAAMSLAACSSSSKSTSADSSSPSDATTSSSSAAAAAPTADQLKSYLLTDSDLPSGWTGTPHQTDPSDAATQAAFESCLGGNSTQDQVAEADSSDYAMGEAQISSSATSYKSADDVKNDVAALTGPKVNSCFQDQVNTTLKKSLPAGATIDNSTITITPGSNGGPQNVVATGKGTITVTVQGQQTTVNLLVGFITGNQVEAEVDYVNPGGTTDADLFTKLLNTVASRVSA